MGWGWDEDLVVNTHQQNTSITKIRSNPDCESPHVYRHISTDPATSKDTLD